MYVYLIHSNNGTANLNPIAMIMDFSTIAKAAFNYFFMKILNRFFPGFI